MCERGYNLLWKFLGMLIYKKMANQANTIVIAKYNITGKRESIHQDIHAIYALREKNKCPLHRTKLIAECQEVIWINTLFHIKKFQVWNCVLKANADFFFSKIISSASSILNLLYIQASLQQHKKTPCPPAENSLIQ